MIKFWCVVKIKFWVLLEDWSRRVHEVAEVEVMEAWDDAIGRGFGEETVIIEVMKEGKS